MFYPQNLTQFYQLFLILIFRFLDLLRRRDVDCTKVKISHLPEEILSELFLFLDGHSILALKRTCRALYRTTKSRHLWNKLVKRLQAEQVQRPEEPLEEYSTGELEKWVLHRLRAQALRNSLTPPVTHQRPLRDFGSGIFTYSSILPGGRWLLALMSGEVYAVDLDSSRLEAYRLFHPGTYTKEGRLDRPSGCCYWIDDTRSRFSFRVGLCGAMTYGSNRYTFTRIVLCQVEIRGHGSDATLVAEPLASMRSPGLGSRPRICLNTEYFVEFLCCPHGDDEESVAHYLRSYRYNANEEVQQEDVKPFTLSIEGYVRFMGFISDNRIVAFDDCGLHIFAISPSENDVQHAISLLYTISSPNSLSFSRLYQTPHSTFKMVVFGDDEVRGVEIPDRDPSGTTIIKLGHQEYHWRTRARVAVGLSAGVIVHSNGGMDLLSYSSGNGEGVTFGRTSCSVGFHRTENVVLSEDLARIVINERNNTTVIDLHSEEAPP